MTNYKILIVDDSIDNLKTMVSIFKKEEPDYRTYQSNRPGFALDIAKEVKPDLIISDWDMPDMNGLELIKSLKSNTETKDIPVIIATGVMLSTDHLKLALEAGAVDYVRKPIESVELLARTKAALLINSYYKQLLEQQNQELTESTLQLLRQQKFISSFSENLEHLIYDLDKDPSKTKSSILELNERLKEQSEKEALNKFNLSFSKVHPEFTAQLSKDHPQLSQTDIKLCSFIRLGISNKEIADVLNQSPDSIKVSRYRLRKKLNLDRSMNMVNYLSRY